MTVSVHPDDRKYSKTHEWYLIEGHILTVGITKFAADELTDITYVDLPAVGSAVKAGQSFGEVESVKATSEVFCAMDGEVVEVNEALADNPGLVNSESYGAGWMLKIRPSDLTGLDELMDATAYEEMLKS